MIPVDRASEAEVGRVAGLLNLGPSESMKTALATMGGGTVRDTSSDFETFRGRLGRSKEREDADDRYTTSPEWRCMSTASDAPV
jgi:hypothetical protein